MTKTKSKIILASGSLRRQELLKKIVKNFDIEVANLNEEDFSHDFHRLPYELSRLKAYAVFKLHPDDIVIASDTIVVLNGVIFNKPKDVDDARKMLSQLSGQIHHVLTAYTIISKKKEVSRVVETTVHFKEIDSNVLEEYIQTKIPYDKSGGYAIQEPKYNFVKRYEGSLENVIGFPVKEIKKDLNQFLD